MRLEWFLMDIAKQSEEIVPVANRPALETLLKEMSYTPILMIVIIYLGGEYALHDLSEGLAELSDEKVDVISHLAVGIYHTVRF